MNNPAIFFLGVLLSSGINCPSVEPQNEAVQDAAAKIKQVWKSEVEKMKGKSFVSHRATILKRLLRKASAKVRQSEFERICHIEIPTLTMDPTDLEKSYDPALLQAFVAMTVEQKDGPGLIELLRHNCPTTVEHLVPLEFYLAEEWTGSIKTLFDAYEKAVSKRVKADIVLCLGRAFAALRDRFPVDSVFVVKSWYTENHERLKINEQYPYLPAQPDEPKRRDLFVFK